MTLRRRVRRHAARRRAARARPRRTSSRSSHTGYTTNLPLADVTGGRAWVAWEVDGAAAAPRARRARPARRAAPLLLEEREVGRRACSSSTTTNPGSGSATATTTAATRGSSSATRETDPMPARAAPWAWQTATVVGIAPRDRAARRRSASSSTGRLEHRRRPALRRAAHRARRLHRARVVLGGVRTRRRSAEVELTVERLDDGEVSTFLHDDVVVGDELEVRGPIGGWFVWDGRHARAAGRRRLGRRAADGDAAPRPPTPADRTSCGWSCRSARPTTSTTRTSCPDPRRPWSTRARRRRGATRPPGRITAADLRAAACSPDATAYVCGSSGFADAAGDLLHRARRGARTHPGRALRRHRLIAPL